MWVIPILLYPLNWYYTTLFHSSIFQVENVLIVTAYPSGEPCHVHLFPYELCERYWEQWLLRLMHYQTLFSSDLTDVHIWQYYNCIYVGIHPWSVCKKYHILLSYILLVTLQYNQLSTQRSVPKVTQIPLSPCQNCVAFVVVNFTLGYVTTTKCVCKVPSSHSPPFSFDFCRLLVA